MSDASSPNDYVVQHMHRGSRPLRCMRHALHHPALVHPGELARQVARDEAESIRRFDLREET